MDLCKSFADFVIRHYCAPVLFLLIQLHNHLNVTILLI